MAIWWLPALPNSIAPWALARGPSMVSRMSTGKQEE